VPDSWGDLRESARNGYLLAIWGASGMKADVRVVGAAGTLLRTYSPAAGPMD